MNWNNDWRDELKTEDPECYERFADCDNKRSDLKKLAKLVYKYNLDRPKEECVDYIIEWVTDANNQPNLIPDEDEYKKILNSL